MDDNLAEEVVDIVEDLEWKFVFRKTLYSVWLGSNACVFGSDTVILSSSQLRHEVLK